MHLVLPTTAEYALRAMACIAGRSDEWVRAKDLVEATHVPAAYLSKVLRRLVEGGLLTSMKGHHGGFRLARPASTIRFVDVLDAVDEEIGSTRCAFGFTHCSGRDPCPLHPMFEQLNQQVRAWAETATLAEVDAQVYLLAPPTRAVVPPRVRAR
ncbi:MAG: Rrf2 family transcriptional regulator [Myxococcota bacterium]